MVKCSGHPNMRDRCGNTPFDECDWEDFICHSFILFNVDSLLWVLLKDQVVQSQVK